MGLINKCRMCESTVSLWADSMTHRFNRDNILRGPQYQVLRSLNPRSIVRKSRSISRTLKVPQVTSGWISHLPSPSTVFCPRQQHDDMVIRRHCWRAPLGTLMLSRHENCPKVYMPAPSLVSHGKGLFYFACSWLHRW